MHHEPPGVYGPRTHLMIIRSKAERAAGVCVSLLRLAGDTLVDILGGCQDHALEFVAVEGLSDEDIKAVEETVTSQMNKALKQPMEIRYEWKDVIQPDANGKLRLIVNEMK